MISDKYYDLKTRIKKVDHAEQLDDACAVFWMLPYSLQSCGRQLTHVSAKSITVITY